MDDHQDVASATPGRTAPAVAVVINYFDEEAFLSDALDSVMAQTRPPDDVLVVDDGSSTPPTRILAGFDGVRSLRQQNGGLAAARNLGLRNVGAEFVVFLDADDRLTPDAIASGLACFADRPSAAMVYGGHRRVDRTLTRASPDQFKPVGADAFGDLLHGNLVAMHAAVMYRARDLREVGGFDEALRACEDYDVYLKLARTKQVAAHPGTVAEYRWHGANMSSDPAAMLATALSVHARYDDRGASHARRAAWLRGRSNWETYYGGTMTADTLRPSKPSLPRRAARRIVRTLREPRWPPPVGRVRLGDLGTGRPVSTDFGYERGLPVDRYYVEAFLAAHRADIAGTVLEVGDDAYSRRFGGDAVVRQDVLHIDADAAGATIVGDLCAPATLPDEAFDCIVLTQTLQFIFDLSAAVDRLHAALRHGGVLLLTVPGITPLERGRWGQTWYWSFTRPSLERLFAPVFGADAVEVGVHGNVLAATAMLQGLAVEDVGSGRLDDFDPAFPTLLTLRALKG